MHLRSRAGATAASLAFRLGGIPQSRVDVLVRGSHGHRLGRAYGRLGPAGSARIFVRLHRWDDQRRLRVRVRSTYLGPDVRIVRRESKHVRLRAPALRRLARR